MGTISVNLGTSEELVGTLRNCGIKGDPNILPYEQAQISIENVSIESLIPLAKYYLEEGIRQIASIRNQLIAEIDIFDLRGRLTWLDNGIDQVIAPPIVELWDNEGHLLVDGMHRVCLARQEGRSIITCVVVRGVTVPLVPLPVSWEKVRAYPPGEMPGTADKRDFRFLDAAELRKAMPEIQDKITDQNYRYFLFREFDAVGSSGIRVAPDNSTIGVISNG